MLSNIRQHKSIMHRYRLVQTRLTELQNQTLMAACSSLESDVVSKWCHAPPDLRANSATQNLQEARSWRRLYDVPVRTDNWAIAPKYDPKAHRHALPPAPRSLRPVAEEVAGGHRVRRRYALRRALRSSVPTVAVSSVLPLPCDFCLPQLYWGGAVAVCSHHRRGDLTIPPPEMNLWH